MLALVNNANKASKR